MILSGSCQEWQYIPKSIFLMQQTKTVSLELEAHCSRDDKFFSYYEGINKKQVMCIYCITRLHTTEKLNYSIYNSFIYLAVEVQPTKQYTVQNSKIHPKHLHFFFPTKILNHSKLTHGTTYKSYVNIGISCNIQKVQLDFNCYLSDASHLPCPSMLCYLCHRKKRGRMRDGEDEGGGGGGRGGESAAGGGR